MNEKIIIKGEFQKNKIALTYVILAALVLVLTLVWGIHRYNQEREWALMFGDVWNVSLSNFLTGGSLNGGNWFGLGYLVAILFLLIGLYFWRKLSRCELNVSDKRVWGKSSFGHQVDLPLHQISTLAYGKRGSILVATSSGKICFWYLRNKEAVYNAISTELAAVQQKSAPASAAAASDADELKKYKDLLDSGVISQAEFDAKKKQLLGL